MLPAPSGSTFARPRRLHDGRRVPLPPRSGVWIVGPTVVGFALLPLARAAGARQEGRRLRHREPCHGLALACLGRLVRACHSIFELPVGTIRRPHGPGSLAASDLRVRLRGAGRRGRPDRLPGRRNSMGADCIPRAAACTRRKVSTARAAGRGDRYRLRDLDVGQHPGDAGRSGDRRHERHRQELDAYPDGAFPWLYLQLQRYLPIVRLRLLPGFVKTVNAEPWLTDVTFFAPWFVLAVELVRRLTGRRADTHTAPRDPGGFAVDHHVSDARACVAGLPPGRHRCADGRPARLGHLARCGPSAARPASSCGRWPSSRSCSRLRARSTYGRVIARVGGVGVDGPTNFVRRLSGVGGCTQPGRWTLRTARRDRPRRSVAMAQRVHQRNRQGGAHRIRAAGLLPVRARVRRRPGVLRSRMEQLRRRIRRWSSNAGLDKRCRLSWRWILNGDRSRETIPRFAAGSMTHYQTVKQSDFGGGETAHGPDRSSSVSGANLRVDGATLLSIVVPREIRGLRRPISFRLAYPRPHRRLANKARPVLRTEHPERRAVAPGEDQILLTIVITVESS